MNTSKKYVKDCSFIPLYDKSIFLLTKLPPNPTHFVLWYKKDSDDNWGLTVKSFPEGEEAYSKSHDWKLTWINSVVGDKLVPTLASETFCEPITDQLYLKLQSIIIDAQRKFKLKQKTQTKITPK